MITVRTNTGSCIKAILSTVETEESLAILIFLNQKNDKFPKIGIS
jgi:hypothetical protein